MNLNSDDWNDDVIIDLFNDAIRTHRTKAEDSQKKRKRVDWTTPLEYVDPGLSSRPELMEKVGGIVDEELEDGLIVEEQESGADVCEASAHGSDTGIDATSEYFRSQTRTLLQDGHPIDEALSTMLMAWYQSGYATGRYQAMLEMREHGATGAKATSDEFR